MNLTKMYKKDPKMSVNALLYGTQSQNSRIHQQQKPLADIRIRHSKSDPLINSSKAPYRFFIEPNAEFAVFDDCELKESNPTVPHPSAWRSSPVTSAMEGSISTEDLFHDMVTIEGLRTLYGSCFSCGVSWQQDHVSLDCVECGGYSMHRPCPECEGKCGTIWRRNLVTTHDSQKASWEGECKLLVSYAQSLNVKENFDSSSSRRRRNVLSSMKVS